ncbi:F1F0 ATP synthase epsilon subunit [Dunaliella salina]|uniref:F1F0 ATP synthase epsilon subunit n=1 Tax=Dunaliella salina TaxID=3046 RepID=A0ABQ7H9L7_DUNSA|nr:F1F0 ATP synthase epsilon subunit [Dunaliella salina]|eukprot:KAF5843535.1 F1F0 ATP synthase epsilon subunit [Dunaliella salina]
MSAPTGAFYRAAGMSFLRYANVSADLLRNVLKEPFKTKAQNRQVIVYRSSPYVDGKQGKQTVIDIKTGMPTKPQAPSTSS